jgi:hypothetical protein
MDWINDNLSTILIAIGFISANVLTPLIRRLPHNNVWFQILRAVLSGCPKEFDPRTPATTEAKPISRRGDVVNGVMPSKFTIHMDFEGPVGSSERSGDAVGANGPNEPPTAA